MGMLFINVEEQPGSYLFTSAKGHLRPKLTVYAEDLEYKGGTDYEEQNGERKYYSFFHFYHLSHYKFTSR